MVFLSVRLLRPANMSNFVVAKVLFCHENCTQDGKRFFVKLHQFARFCVSIPPELLLYETKFSNGPIGLKSDDCRCGELVFPILVQC